MGRRCRRLRMFLRLWRDDGAVAFDASGTGAGGVAADRMVEDFHFVFRDRSFL
jgi:hypothetical protein